LKKAAEAVYNTEKVSKAAKETKKSDYQTKVPVKTIHA
jgi:hypothetical protein